MINQIIRGLVYFLLFMLIQLFVLNHIHFMRMATPFLYVYILLKMPVGMSRINLLLVSFAVGLLVDMFSNTGGMHAASCVLLGLVREPLLYLLKGKDLADGLYPSFKLLGKGAFFRYTLFLVMTHHIVLFLIESLTLFDPLFLTWRILSSVLITTVLICTVEALNIETQTIGE